jgi:hypothetical protein
MTPDQIADRIIELAVEYKIRTDMDPSRHEVKAGHDVGICLGLKTGADKLREALKLSNDLALIADETDRFADAYMAMLKRPETLTDKETAYHHGIKRGLNMVAQLLRTAISGGDVGSTPVILQ